MNAILEQAIAGLFEVVLIFVLSVATYYTKTVLVPWLKDKQLYDDVKRFVRAAQKLADTGAIPKVDKKAYVMKRIREKGYTVTPTVESYIESAVGEVDDAAKAILGILAEEADTDEEADAEDPEPPSGDLDLDGLDALLSE